MGVGAAACDEEAMRVAVIALERSRRVVTGAGDDAGAGVKSRERGARAGRTVGGEMSSVAGGRPWYHSWAHSY